jgi:outer membrane protein assembly factor BamB
VVLRCGSIPTGRNVYASPALAADGTLWIGSGDRWLYAISD